VCECNGCGQVHPDHIINISQRLVSNRRYQLYNDSVYLLDASLTTASGSTQLVAELFSIEDPGATVTGTDDDDLLWTLSHAAGLRPHREIWTPGLYAKHGLFAQVTAGSAGETGWLHCRVVRRSEYCCAFGNPPNFLADCWEASAGRAGTPLWSNFDSGEINDSWEDSGGENTAL